MKLILCWQNAVTDGATQLGATSDLGNMPVAHLRDARMGRRWRSAGTASAEAVFGSSKDIDLLALAFPRDTTAPSGTIRHFLDGPGGTPGAGALYDSGPIDIGVVPGYGYHVHRLPAAVMAGSWVWTYTLARPFCDTGLAWAGKAWSPRINMQYGAGDQWRDLSRIAYSRRSGAEFPDKGPRQRAVSFSLDFMDEATAATVEELRRIAGVSEQVLAITYPENAARKTVMGRMEEANPVLHTAHDIRSTPFVIRESL